MTSATRGWTRALSIIPSLLSRDLVELGKFCFFLTSRPLLTLASTSKTQLVSRYAFDRRERNPGTSVLWISARTEGDIEAGFKSIAEKMSLSWQMDGRVRYKDEIPKQSALLDRRTQPRSRNDSILLKDWMLSPAHTNWLLILDNYDDIQVPVHKFLPVGAVGSIIITTRDRQVIGPVANTGFTQSAMDLLDAEKLFLRIQSVGTDKLWSEPRSHPEYAILGHVLQELQCFPLVIDQAASFIRENSPMTFHEYFNYLEPRSTDRERLMRFKQANPRYPKSIMTTWEISPEFLQRVQPRACLILQLLGFLDHSYISEKLLTDSTKERPWTFDATFQGQ